MSFHKQLKVRCGSQYLVPPSSLFSYTSHYLPFTVPSLTTLLSLLQLPIFFCTSHNDFPPALLLTIAPFFSLFNAFRMQPICLEQKHQIPDFGYSDKQKPGPAGFTTLRKALSLCCSKVLEARLIDTAFRKPCRVYDARRSTLHCSQMYWLRKNYSF